MMLNCIAYSVCLQPCKARSYSGGEKWVRACRASSVPSMASPCIFFRKFTAVATVCNPPVCTQTQDRVTRGRRVSHALARQQGQTLVPCMATRCCHFKNKIYIAHDHLVQGCYCYIHCKGVSPNCDCHCNEVALSITRPFNTFALASSVDFCSREEEWDPEWALAPCCACCACCASGKPAAVASVEAAWGPFD